jgi:hypothetical protein
LPLSLLLASLKLLLLLLVGSSRLGEEGTRLFAGEGRLLLEAGLEEAVLVVSPRFFLLKREKIDLILPPAMLLVF